MAFIIPWIFRAGTKAKSAEVNENFLAVKQFVDLLEEDVAANQIAVEMLEDTKANLNGNATERFQVANAIVGNDAVNLNTLETNTQNARGYIDGYRLNYAGKQVTANAGTCYSYNPQTGDYEHLIKSDTTITTEPLTLGANATYYVFVCGDSTGNVFPALSAGVNKETPSLPAGTDCWRRIGWFTTDEDGAIEEIYNEGDQIIPNTTGFVGTRLTNQVTVKGSENPIFTADSDIWVLLTQYHTSGEAGYTGWVWMDLEINNNWIYIAIVGRSAHIHQYPSTCLIPVKKGQRYRFRGDGWAYCYTFDMVR